MQFARDKSPLTSVVIMTARKSYETAVKAFRAGAADVVLKEPDVVPYLRERVVEAATDIKATADRNSLLEEVAETHEEFLRRLRDVAREGLDLEDRLAGRADDVAVTNATRQRRAGRRRSEGPRGPGQGVDRGGGLALRAALTGGEALDVVPQERPQIVMVKEDLPIFRQHGRAHREVERARRRDAALHPARPGRAPGRREAGRRDGTMNTIASYADPGQLAAPLGEIREALRAKGKERRYLQAFRQRHFEFLQRYNNIKHRLKRAGPAQVGRSVSG